MIVAWGLIFIFLYKLCTWTTCGSLISRGHLPVSASIGGLWIEVMGHWKSCPLWTSFVFNCILSYFILLEVNTMDDIWPPRATTSTSSLLPPTWCPILHYPLHLILGRLSYFLWTGFDIRDFSSKCLLPRSSFPRWHTIVKQLVDCFPFEYISVMTWGSNSQQLLFPHQVSLA